MGITATRSATMTPVATAPAATATQQSPALVSPPPALTPATRVATPASQQVRVSTKNNNHGYELELSELKALFQTKELFVVFVTLELSVILELVHCR